ncbi:GNAT family N-acetyltransferase [Paenibacillus sp. GCM10027626]|uniref:GNAT family N-acetyltransferase n=1 Tax=Paenibacillus sp. GCM10027626 TaxID=3273411 RepID=UPI003629E25D
MIDIKSMKLEDASKIWEIDRSEIIEYIYTCADGQLNEFKAGHECPNWEEGQYSEIIARYEEELRSGGMAVGAFAGETLVGFGVLAHQFRGENNDQLQVDLMYVTREYRRQGIGRRIITALSEEAVVRGAKYLYISSTETESAVKFYSSFGAELTPEVDEELFAKEPEDIHMIKKL